MAAASVPRLYVKNVKAKNEGKEGEGKCMKGKEC